MRRLTRHAIRELLHGGAVHAGESDQADFLASSPRERARERSRQATHARMNRAMTAAVVGCTLRAADSAEYTTLLTTPEFARLRPMAAATQARFGYLLSTSPQLLVPDAAVRLWERMVPRFLRLATRYHTLDIDGLLGVFAAINALYLGPAAYGALFADPWRELMKDAKHRRILDNPVLRLKLIMMGSFCGLPGAHVDWLLDPETNAVTVADGLCFVRRDHDPDLLWLTARSVRGDVNHPDDCLLASDPASTLVNLARFVRSGMRDPRSFHNEGLILMLLHCAEEVLHRAGGGGHARDVSLLEADLGRLFVELRRIDTTLVLEKNRFYRVYDRLPPSPVRTRLRALWSQAFSARSS